MPPISGSEADVAFVEGLVVISERVKEKAFLAADIAGQVIPIRVYFRATSMPNKRTELLRARVDYTWPNRISDLRGLHGCQVALWVIRESMERYPLEYYNRGFKNVPH